jgi:hypothetical protein
MNGTSTSFRQTNAVYRDPSAWYHVVLAVDTTQATEANKLLLWINNVAQTYTVTNAITTCGLNANAATVNIGRYSVGATNYFDGYIAEQNFIDGQALTPSSFGSTNATTGVWQPAAYTGSYGTNGFYLPFTDNSALTTSSNVGLGKDFSGNGNYWTTNNISLTAGVTYDSMTDVPTLTSATAANFCVMNAIAPYGSALTLTEANLKSTVNGVYWAGAPATIGVSSGKWYWEVTVSNLTGNLMVGITKDTEITGTSGINTYPGITANSYGYSAGGQKYNNATQTSYGAAYTTSDVIGVALDMGAGTITFYKNNTSQGTAFSSLSGTYLPSLGVNTSPSALTANFGQRPFTYTPPSGFVALNTYNLPTSTIVKGNTVMDATTYTGTGAIQSITNAAGFKPDLLWVKGRSRVSFHDIVDSVRGVNLALSSNSTNAEITGSFITSLNSNGFTLPANTTSDTYFTNVSGDTMVGWQWQAGQGSTSSNTNGTITSTVSVNASAGFSVVTYTGTGLGATVGHGLGVAPQFIITKNRSAASAWHCYVAAIPNMQNGYIVLNSTAAFSTSTPTVWNGTQPTSSVFSVGTDSGTNGSGNAEVAYCWTPIAGYSAFGSYTGNGSTDGPFVYTGFKPKFVLYKNSSTTTDWVVFDTSRNTYNVTNSYLLPDTSGAEGTLNALDIVSNGFKIRDSSTGTNGSGNTFIYMAFAENPFKNSLAR